MVFYLGLISQKARFEACVQQGSFTRESWRLVLPAGREYTVHSRLRGFRGRHSYNTFYSDQLILLQSDQKQQRSVQSGALLTGLVNKLLPPQINEWLSHLLFREFYDQQFI